MSINSISLGEKPFYPIMGEMHFSRVSALFWRDHLLKMKSAGINIISTYVFWIHHEEREGEFNWHGDRNLRAFLRLCRDLGFFVFLRMGPWCHGEVRNGGFPDWLRWGYIRKRGNYPLYLKKVERYFKELIYQCRDFSWDENGPILGIQIENEFHIKNEKDREYLLNLKEMVINMGLKVPVYGLTAWPPSKYYPFKDFLPFWGDYPATPWAGHTGPVDRSNSFHMKSDPVPEDIGADLLKGKKGEYIREQLTQNPYALVELGPANQISDKRRPSFKAIDGYAMAVSKVGSGVSWMGYYMFSGGTNPRGEKYFLEESRKTAYPNTYPRLSYDFHAPLGEWGRLNPSYYPLKNLHYLLKDYESLFFCESWCRITDSRELSISRRGNKEGEFLFINRYRRNSISESKSVALDFADYELHGPVLQLPPELCTILPLRLKTGESSRISGSVLPLGKLSTENGDSFFFGEIKGLAPVLLLESETEPEAPHAYWAIRKTRTKLYEIEPEVKDKPLVLQETDTSGKKIRYIFLPEKQATRFWKDNDSMRVITGPRSVLFDQDKIIIQGEKPQFTWFDWEDTQGYFQERQQSGTEIIETVDFMQVAGSISSTQWKIMLPPKETIEGEERFLSFQYEGDKAELFGDGRLLCDHFNQGFPWEISLSRLEKTAAPLPKDLYLKIRKRSPMNKLYYEGPASKQSFRKAKLKECTLKSEPIFSIQDN